MTRTVDSLFWENHRILEPGVTDRLRTLSELFPEVIQGGDGLPSCRALEALERQESFVNPTLANPRTGPTGATVSVRHDPLSRGIRRTFIAGGLGALRIDPQYRQGVRKKARAERLRHQWLLQAGNHH
jgi:hypothetical protein